jgi:hypothetical protein
MSGHGRMLWVTSQVGQVRSYLTFSIREDWRQVAAQPDLQNAKRKAHSERLPCRSSIFSPKRFASAGVWLYIFLCPLIFLNHKSSCRNAYKCFIELHSALSRRTLLRRVNRFDAIHDRFDLIVTRIGEYGTQQFSISIAASIE